jgi:LPXTG-motif cell wall-anchored protein
MVLYGPWGLKLEARALLFLAALIPLLALEGVAASHSLVWAAPLLCLIVVAVAADLPLVPVVGLALVVRVLTDASLSAASRQTGAFNLSAAIAGLFILIAIGLLLRRRRGQTAALLTVAWLAAWTAVTINVDGLSTVTIREGVREASIVALGLIVYNSRAINLGTAVRIVQVAGVGAAVVALFQLATHSGPEILGEVRSNGTFFHPDGAATYFAIATVASVWQFFDNGRRRLDLLLAALFAAATIATFSLAGLASLLAMLLVYGSLRPGSLKLKLRAYAVAVLVIGVFLATPAGAERLNEQSGTQLTTSRKLGAESTSLAWRFFKWGTLIDEWERKPLFGHGLGTTVTGGGVVVANATNSRVPHNEYLRYLVETGIVGFALLLAALGWLLRTLVRQRGRRGSAVGAAQRSAAGLAIAVVAGCMVDALADNTFLYTTTGYATALIVAAALATPYLRRQP